MRCGVFERITTRALSSARSSIHSVPGRVQDKEADTQQPGRGERGLRSRRPLTQRKAAVRQHQLLAEREVDRNGGRSCHTTIHSLSFAKITIVLYTLSVHPFPPLGDMIRHEASVSTLIRHTPYRPTLSVRVWRRSASSIVPGSRPTAPLSYIQCFCKSKRYASKIRCRRCLS